MKFDRRLFNLTRLASVKLILTSLLSILGAGTVIIWARLLSRIISQVFLDGKNLSQSMPLLWVLLGVIGIRVVLQAGAEISAAALAVQVKTQLRKDLLDHIRKLGPGFIQNESTGALANSAIQGIEMLDAFFSQYVPQIIIAGVLPLLILIFVFPLDLLTAVIFLVTAPLIPIFMILIGKTSEKLTSKQFLALNKMSSYFLDSLQGLSTLKLFNQGQNEIRKVRQISEKYRLTTMNVLRLTFLSALVLEWLSTLSVAVVAVEIGIRLLYSQMAFEDSLFILIIAPEFYQPLRMLGLRYHASASGLAAANRIFEVLNQPILYQEPRQNEISNNLPQIQAPYKIEFKNITVQYDGRSEKALDGINLILPEEKMTALVGQSGAGKSTLSNLLMRFVQPSAGEILVNGQNIQSLPIDWWRSQISWVPQRPYLFNASLEANLRIGKKDATESELWQAVQKVKLDETLARLPDGLATQVGEGGLRLSGGQAQRLALARAFLRDAPLVIMDEPTSHLDPEHENVLIEASRQLCKGKTVLIIAHRLATVNQADQIVVFENGKILEIGHHTELVREMGTYAALLQAYRGLAS